MSNGPVFFDGKRWFSANCVIPICCFKCKYYKWYSRTSVKSSMVYPVQALFFLSLIALKNIHVAMAMLIFLCLVRNKPASPAGGNYFDLTEAPHLT